MGNLIKYLIFTLLSASLISCDLDLTGFIRSTDRIEDRFQQSMAYNENNPINHIISTEENYSVLCASDLHIGKTENAEYLFNLYENSQDLALILNGDLVTGRKENYEVFYNLTKLVSKPLFTTAGNHELYFDGWKYYYEFFGSSTYYFVIETPTEQDLFICLDSGSASLGKSQIKWLEDLLKNERSKYRHCTVIGHTNMLRVKKTTTANSPSQELEYLMCLFTEYKIDLVLNGHSHSRNLTKFGNTNYVITDPLIVGHKNAGYSKIIYKTGEIDIEFIKC